MYATVTGGETAIDNAHRWLADCRRGDRDRPELDTAGIRAQLGRAVDRVMSEGSVADPDLAAVALKQAQGDATEAIFLLRAYRNTLPRLGISEPLDTEAMGVERRITPVFKDTPGGQMLGPTFDYTHRLLDLTLAAPTDPPVAPEQAPADNDDLRGVLAQLADEGFADAECPDDDTLVSDVTREPVSFPAPRDARLQILARGDEGFLLGLAYASQRGHGAHKVYAGEIRQGEVSVEFVPDELGYAVDLGLLRVSECLILTPEQDDSDCGAGLASGYGLALGRSERKAISMALLDRTLQARERGERVQSPSQDEAYVLAHADSVPAAGFLEHLKLPHYVDFQAELTTLRELQRSQPASGQEDV